MPIISLYAKDITSWLEKKGFIVSNSFWQVLKVGCEKDTLFEYEFVINDVPWIGAIKLFVTFINANRIEEFRWPITVSGDRKQILVAEISMIVLIANKNRRGDKSKRIVPYLTIPEYGMSIEYPTLNELDKMWGVLIKTAPKMIASMEKFLYDFESEIDTPTREPGFYKSIRFG